MWDWDMRTVKSIDKRIVDICGSIFGLVLFSPFFLMIAILIKLEDSGPILFKQTRVGINGTHFVIFKFRSMCIDAEAQKKNYLEDNEIAGSMFKMKNDPRVTKIGKFIRKTSLDELPQFINVLLGNMSLVGPRPPLVEEVKNYSTRDKKRLLIKPGMTGLWQVSGRNNLSFSEMVKLDLIYIQKQSFWYDFKIMIRTLVNMFFIKKNGAF